MGNLKPDAKYIYERADGVIYAREIGSNERHVVGYDSFGLRRQKAQLWKDVLVEAETNPTLQKALDNAIMIYRLSKDNPL